MRDLSFAALALLIAALLCVLVYQNYRQVHDPQITTTYQAVTLVSGAVFYGRIAHLGTDRPVLRDAVEIRTGAGAQAAPVVVRRKDSPTGADHLIFPAASIAMVEPVQRGSAIDTLLRAALGERN